MCEVEFVERFPEVVPLERLRAEPALEGMLILRKGNRLSVTPLDEGEFEAIRALGAGGAPSVRRKSTAKSAEAVPTRKSR
jgi:predicted RNA-binding protein with PUA-like domain